MHAIGLIESNSIAKGVEFADTMVKTAEVDILVAKSICPGKYIVLVGGDVSAVTQAVNAGLEVAPSVVVDHFIIPNIHPSILPAISGGTAVDEVRAVGVLETYSVAATIEAADLAVKAASVTPIRMHLAFGIGGKSYVVFTGDVADINAAIAVGAESASDKGFLVNKVVIPRPHQQVINSLL
ncbi:BMC domain-containing protein [Neisseria sp. Ec49-e6-T10]|uniref:BMC domain-containing protein n=1 Tax=Neisseria sp. Ec49-e6-T10 TaxID=3140744 RepID=UPI003EBD0757